MKKSYRRILSVGLFVVLIGGLVFALTGCGFFGNVPNPVINTVPKLEDGVVSADVGQTIEFDGSKSTPEDKIDSYSWDFGTDDFTPHGETAPGATQTGSYTVAGEYTVILTVSLEDGPADSLKIKADISD